MIETYQQDILLSCLTSKVPILAGSRPLLFFSMAKGCGDLYLTFDIVLMAHKCADLLKCYQSLGNSNPLPLGQDIDSLQCVSSDSLNLGFPSLLEF